MKAAMKLSKKTAALLELVTRSRVMSEKAWYLIESFINGEWRRRTTLRDVPEGEALGMLMRWRAIDPASILRTREVTRRVADHGENNEYTKDSERRAQILASLAEHRKKK